MAGKGTAGVGIVAAALLIFWAVANPGPDQSENSPASTISPSSTAFRMAGGAVLGGQAEILTVAATPPGLDTAALQALLAQYLAEAGVTANQAEIQALVARYNSIANQAQAFLNNPSAAQSLGGLVPSGLPSLAGIPKIDPALVAALVNSDPQLRRTVESRLGDQRLARLNQVTGAAPAGGSGAPAAGADGFNAVPDFVRSAAADEQLTSKDDKDDLFGEDFAENSADFKEDLKEAFGQ